MTRRIRSVNGIASHKNVVRTDIRHAAKIIFNLDKQRDLWPEDESGDKNDGEEQVPAFGLKSRNPLLKNIGDYMIEEANAEEEELLGEGATEEGEENGSGQSLDRDENLNKVLDRLLLYLRIVHSVDYYNHSDYPNEDEMPNRIGIMHARGAPPSSKVTIQEVNEYIKTFETKIKPFLTVSTFSSFLSSYFNQSKSELSIGKIRILFLSKKRIRLCMSKEIPSVIVNK